MKANIILSFSLLLLILFGCSSVEDENHIENKYAGKYSIQLSDGDNKVQIIGSLDISINKYGNLDAFVRFMFVYADSIVELDTYIHEDGIYSKDSGKFEGLLIPASKKDLILLRDNVEYYFYNNTLTK